MEHFEWVSIDAALEDFIDLIGARNTRIDKSYLCKIANDIAQKLTFKSSSVTHKVKLYQVEDGRIILSDELFSIVQALYKEHKQEKKQQIQVTEWIQHLYNGCDIKINADCPSCGEDEAEIDVDYWFEWNHPQRIIGNKRTVGFGGLENYDRDRTPLSAGFKLLRYKQSNFAGVRHVDGCMNLDKHLLNQNVEEYWTENDGGANILYTTFDKGEILLSYLEYKTDERGYRLIPNLPDVIDAIVWGMQEKYMYREYMRTRDRSYLNDSNEARQKREIAMGRAREVLKMPKLEEWNAVIENIIGRMHSNWRPGSLGNYKRDDFSHKMNRLTRR